MNKKNFIIIVAAPIIILAISSYIAHKGGPFPGPDPFVVNVITFPFRILSVPLWLFGLTGVFFAGQLLDDFFVFSSTVGWFIIVYIYFLIYEKYLSNYHKVIKFLLRYILLVIMMGILAGSVFAYQTGQQRFVLDCLEGKIKHAQYSDNSQEDCFTDWFNTENTANERLSKRGGNVFNIEDIKWALDFCAKMPSDKEIVWKEEKINIIVTKNILPPHTSYRDYCFMHIAKSKMHEFSKRNSIPPVDDIINQGSRLALFHAMMGKYA